MMRLTRSDMAVCTAALVLLLEAPASAYLDPGSGSMLVQVLLGGVAGVAVLLKLGWNRLRGMFGANRRAEQERNADG